MTAKPQIQAYVCEDRVQRRFSSTHAEAEANLQSRTPVAGYSWLVPHERSATDPWTVVLLTWSCAGGRCGVVWKHARYVRVAAPQEKTSMSAGNSGATCGTRQCRTDCRLVRPA